MPKASFLDTSRLARISTAQGEVTEILNAQMQGAKNVLAALRWLRSGQTFKADAGAKHQLLYLMEGRGTIVLDHRSHAAEKGMGVYLGPSETAAISAAPSATVKLLHLVVAATSEAVRSQE